MREVDQPGAGDSLLIQLGNELAVGVDLLLDIRDLLVDICGHGGAVVDGKALGLQVIDLLDAGQLLLVQLVGLLDVAGEGTLGRNASVQQLPGLVDLGDGMSQFVIALAGLGDGAVRVQLLGGGEQGLDLGIGSLQTVRHVLTGLLRLVRRLPNLRPVPGEHLLDLLFHHV